MKPNVLITTNIPSPYRVDFFNELGKYVNLTVLFEKDRSDERSKKWVGEKFDQFESLFLKGIKFTADTALSLNVVKYLYKFRTSKILILNPLTPTGLLSILFLRIMKIKFMVETDGAFYKQNERISNLIRSFAYKKAYLVFSTSSVHDDYYRKLGVKPDKIVRYPFTSIMEKDIIHEPISYTIRAELKRKLNIKEKIVVLTVGQFIPRKGFDLLINASKSFSEEVGFYFIGGSNTELYKEHLEGINKVNLHFLDFMSKDELRNYYQASDLFVLPTREDIWGLVINEAMANGLPVITSNRCLAGTVLVSNSKNGYLFKNEDVSDLVEKISLCLKSDKHLFSEFSLNSIESFTIEKMAASHLEYLK